MASQSTRKVWFNSGIVEIYKSKVLMLPRVDWAGVIRELRLLVMQLQSARFFALYALLFMLVAAYVVGYVVDKLGRIQ